MAKTKRALIALLLVGCSEDFRNAAHTNIVNSDGGNTVHIPDNRPDARADTYPLDVQHQDATTENVVPIQRLPDSAVDRTPNTPDDASPLDAGPEAANTPETGDATAAYCVDCQPVLGRPACCSVYHVCGHLNGLNQCTRN